MELVTCSVPWKFMPSSQEYDLMKITVMHSTAIFLPMRHSEVDLGSLKPTPPLWSSSGHQGSPSNVNEILAQSLTIPIKTTLAPLASHHLGLAPGSSILPGHCQSYPPYCLEQPCSCKLLDPCICSVLCLDCVEPGHVSFLMKPFLIPRSRAVQRPKGYRAMWKCYGIG